MRADIRNTEKPPSAGADAASGGLSALAGVAPVGSEVTISPDVQKLADELASLSAEYDAEHGAQVRAEAVERTPEGTRYRVKEVLPPGVYMTADHRYYVNGEGPFPSVTTILEILSKPALVYWKAKQSAEAMWNALNPLTGRLPDLQVEAGTPAQELERTKDVLIKWALQQSDSIRDKAAGIGTGVHLLADLISRQGAGAAETPLKAFQVSEEEKPYAEAFSGFLAFLEAQGGRIVSSEHAVYSLNGYAGTYDLIVELPDLWIPERDEMQLWLIDIKTSKGYYPEYGLQLAGYRWADYIVLEGDPRLYPMPEIHRTGVLHLRPEQYERGWSLVEYPITYEKDYLTFLGALEVWKWRKEGRFQKQNLNTVT